MGGHQLARAAVPCWTGDGVRLPEIRVRLPKPNSRPGEAGPPRPRGPAQACCSLGRLAPAEPTGAASSWPW